MNRKICIHKNLIYLSFLLLMFFCYLIFSGKLIKLKTYLSPQAKQVTNHSTLIWSQNQIRPHFKAIDIETNQFTDIEGSPQAVKVKDGKIYLEFFVENIYRYLAVDPLAIKSITFGEHPAEKILRMVNSYNLQIDPVIKAKLLNPDTKDDYFHQITFETQPDEFVTQVIVEVSDDGSFLTAIKELPPSWISPDTTYLTPQFFTVSPDLITPVKKNQQIENYRKRIKDISRILSKIRDDQNISNRPLFFVDSQTKEAEELTTNYLATFSKLYSESLKEQGYMSLVNSIGYFFNPKVYGSSLYDQANGIFNAEGMATTFYHSYWQMAKLKEIGVPLNEEDYFFEQQKVYVVDNVVYFIVKAKINETNKKVGRVYALSKSGELKLVYESLGGLYLGLPVPIDPKKLLVSSEGYSDFRFQSIYEHDTETNQDTLVKFPNSLFASDAEFLDKKGTMIIANYGFIYENGGIYKVSKTGNGYSVDKLLLVDHLINFSLLNHQINNTYHALSPITTTPNPTSVYNQYLPLIFDKSPTTIVWTAKEVNNDFAMTINEARLNIGKKTEIINIKTIGKMMGWNPFLRFENEKINGKYEVIIEQTRNFESYISGYAPAVFLVEIGI